MDAFVHEFCKLFGRTGSPEYACGVVKIKMSAAEGEEHSYYQTCPKVKLHRQVGSRYFVSAGNATKILFLRNAALEFLKFTGEDRVGNKLERDVFAVLQDPNELDHLKADSLMYYHGH